MRKKKSFSTQTINGCVICFKSRQNVSQESFFYETTTFSMTHVTFGHAPQSRKSGRHTVEQEQIGPSTSHSELQAKRPENSGRTAVSKTTRKPIQYFSASLAQATFSSTTCCRCGGKLKALTVFFQESNAHLTLLESEARLRTLIQLEIAPRRLRGSSYSASLRQKLFGTAKKLRTT